MTEQERYAIEKDLVTEKLYIWDYDDPICEIDDDKTLITLVNLLNKLNEENEELKQENHDIKHKIEEIYYTYIYKPSENYDEDSCDKIIGGILKGVENYEDG